ncbi:SDR family NAD(P)-dependent oxidoreductase [Marinobacter nanhaiticus D15-8W]|uniref:SDR family oxidoreductase n=1 Tax=Marinobacter nanhaiticus D15-8W TaxID=626887 RepID=N6WUW2_9GAMM|nr:SDR family oxidoreductase [Marinobacter nanhaiticus]ENO14797.1 SDR family oxidoreductase [Marinobacter nanhaiticus D15-8W]BES69514.1 SDR family NAD(P)-dependent oxidoreductase [Marinobacter nanhaiticus D15-8W]
MPTQTVWITGASSGIGEALAARFARDGTNLVLSARRENELKRVADRCTDAGLDRDQILILPLDVTDWDALPGAVQTVLDTFGTIDLLVNNAGVSQRSLCKDTDMAVYRKLMDVDVMGQIALTKAVLPHMLERRDGHIAVTASVAGKVGVPQRTGYCAAKHAVMGFFDALRAEVEDDGIHVSTIVPGFIRTDISRNALAADGKAFGKVDDDIAGGMDVDECAEVVFNALKARKREIPVGKGKEMAALWVKRIAPEVLFKLTKARN